jgi:hypothetical protein
MRQMPLKGSLRLQLSNLSMLILGVIIFGSVWFLSKKITKPKFLFFEKKTETEPKPNRNRVKPTGFGSVRFF